MARRFAKSYWLEFCWGCGTHCPRAKQRDLTLIGCPPGYDTWDMMQDSGRYRLELGFLCPACAKVWPVVERFATTLLTAYRGDYGWVGATPYARSLDEAIEAARKDLPAQFARAGKRD